jgi:hypothetical protein
LPPPPDLAAPSAGRAAALAYAKLHFAAFQHSRLRDIQRLMGCLLYYDRRGGGSAGGSSSSMEVDGADAAGEAAGSSGGRASG